jgi:hypothetical protein
MREEIAAAKDAELEVVRLDREGASLADRNAARARACEAWRLAGDTERARAKHLRPMRDRIMELYDAGWAAAAAGADLESCTYSATHMGGVRRDHWRQGWFDQRASVGLWPPPAEPA